MTQVKKFWKFNQLPEAARTVLLTTRVEDARNTGPVDLFSSSTTADDFDGVVALRVGTDAYEGYDPDDALDEVLMKFVKPRVEKSTAERKRRTKDKAEVFTPTWVVKAQNDLLDEGLGEVAWHEYVAAPVLEITCGEGPYLMTPYDAATGDEMALHEVDEDGRIVWGRTGLLDRKLQRVSDNITSWNDWLVAATMAVMRSYGYEWQGDNLVLARMNLINTFFDYAVDFASRVCGTELKKLVNLDELVVEVAALAAVQLWQMDGLKGVLPNSCVSNCAACANHSRKGHAGLASVVPDPRTTSGNFVRFEQLMHSPDVVHAVKNKVVKPKSVPANHAGLF